MNQNGINFSINNETLTILNNKISLDSIPKLQAGRVTPVINAVAIDWNNAEIGNDKFINTTGELITWIKEIENHQNESSNNNTILTNEQLSALNYLVNFVKQIKNNGNIEENDSDYYFYVGLNKPTINTTITNTVGVGQMGWHLIGNTLFEYTVANPVYKGGDANQTININPGYNDVDFYVAIPVELSLYDGFGTYLNNDFIDTRNVTINSHQYNIFKIHNSDFLFSIYN